MGITLIDRLFDAPRRIRRALSFPALFLSAVLLVACGAETNLLPPATNENVSRSFSVFALTGSSSALPSGYSFTTEQVARLQILASGSLNFDIAFDLTADNRVRLLPVRSLVPLPPGATPNIGLQTSAAGFGSLVRAPDRGFAIDSALVVNVGELVLLQISPAPCPFNDPFFAKLVVDSVVVAERRMVVRSLINRNCGFRSLTAGIPQN